MINQKIKLSKIVLIGLFLLTLPLAGISTPVSETGAVLANHTQAHCSEQFLATPPPDSVGYEECIRVQALCVDTGGTWTAKAGGGEPVYECVCDGEDVFNTSSGCEDPDKTLCENTGGVWVISAGGGTPTGSCSCTSAGPGFVFIIPGGCQDPSVPPPGGTTDPTGGQDADFTPVGTSNLTTPTIDIETNPIFLRLIEIVNILSVGVGIIVTISVVIAGIQYTTSRGDPAKTQKAVARLTSAGIALALFIFGWTVLNWLIPGGVLN